MGLFSFFKNAGLKLFGKKKLEETPAPPPTPEMSSEDIMNRQKGILLKGVINNLNIPVTNLSVDVNRDVATVYGQVDRQSEKEKIILTVGNIDGIGFVDDRISVLNPEPESVFYTVQKGDSLSKIAKRFYGNAMAYPKIFEANKPMLSDPDKIYPGQNLRIPQEEGTYSASMNTYEVKSGDSLSKIAKEVYGNAMAYKHIFEANQPMLSNPDDIRPGQILNIPPMA